MTNQPEHEAVRRELDEAYAMDAPAAAPVPQPDSISEQIELDRLADLIDEGLPNGRGDIGRVDLVGAAEHILCHGFAARPVPQPEPGADTVYEDLTARLAAADLGWAHEHGDPAATPEYIQRLAFQVMAFQPPLVAGVYVDEAMLGRMRERLHGSRCGCGEWDSHGGEYVDAMDATIHAVLWPLRPANRAVPQGTEDADWAAYNEQIERAIESHTPHDRLSEWQDISEATAAVLAVPHPATAEAARLREITRRLLSERDNALDERNEARAELATLPKLTGEAARLRQELESFVEASLEECDYTSDGESGGWEPDDYERAKANIAEMHRVLLVRLERLFQADDREKMLLWLLAESEWKRQQADESRLAWAEPGRFEEGPGSPGRAVASSVSGVATQPAETPREPLNADPCVRCGYWRGHQVWCAEMTVKEAERDAARESRDQYKSNWDRCRAANETALETIASLRAELATRPKLPDDWPDEVRTAVMSVAQSWPALAEAIVRQLQRRFESWVGADTGEGGR